MLKNKDLFAELLLLHHAKNYKVSLFLFFVYGERHNQKLIKAPYCQHHMHSTWLLKDHAEYSYMPWTDPSKLFPPYLFHLIPFATTAIT